MRKKTQKTLFDNIMWYLIYLLPLIAYLFLLIRTGNIISLSDTFNTLGLNILTDNFILSALTGLFGAEGILPFFISSDILIFMSYFIGVYLVHLAVDVLLFIPRFCHKLMDSFGGKINE